MDGWFGLLLAVYLLLLCYGAAELLAGEDDE